jgi:hypothetical protein
VVNPTMAYLGFRTTTEGREYTVRVSGLSEAREFVLFIAHRMFAAGEARFQDAPDLCFAKLRRELSVDPALRPELRLVLTTEELNEYRADHRTPINRRRGSG